MNVQNVTKFDTFRDVTPSINNALAFPVPGCTLKCFWNKFGRNEYFIGQRPVLQRFFKTISK